MARVVSPARTTAMVVKQRMATEVSASATVAVMRRVMMSRIAPRKAPASGSTATQRSASPPGLNITRTPARPTNTAVQRRQPTVSPSSGTTSAVRNSGPAKAMATTSAIGMALSATR